MDKQNLKRLKEWMKKSPQANYENYNSYALWQNVMTKLDELIREKNG